MSHPAKQKATPQERATRKAKRDTGLRLRRARLRKHLSPEQLGLAVGVSGRTIRRLEEGVGPRLPHPRTMGAICEELGEDVGELWYLEQLRQGEQRAKEAGRS